MSAEAWASVLIMALFNVLSTAYYTGVAKQMLNEVMRRVTVVEEGKAEQSTLNLHMERIRGEQTRQDEDIRSVRHDVKGLLQRREAMRGGE